GRRLGREVRSDRAAGAAPVVDDDRLAELLAEPLRDDAADDVVAAAGREGDDQADPFRRIAKLSARRWRNQQQQGCGNARKGMEISRGANDSAHDLGGSRCLGSAPRTHRLKNVRLRKCCLVRVFPCDSVAGIYRGEWRWPATRAAWAAGWS